MTKVDKATPDVPAAAAAVVKALREALPVRDDRAKIVGATYAGAADDNGLPPLDDAGLARAVDSTADRAADDRHDDDHPRGLPWKIAMRWSNPHRPRPDGWPEVLAETVIEQPAGKGAPREEEWPEAFRRAIDADERSRPGRGYSLFIGQDQAVLHEQRKAWSPERKAETRLRELRRRVEKDAGPLFAHTVTDLVAVEVNARPDYFDPRRLEAFAERERERSDAFLADRLAYAKTLARGRPLPRAGGSYVDESPAALGRMTPGEHAAWNANDRTRQWLEVRGWMAGAYALPDGDDAPSTGEERA